MDARTGAETFTTRIGALALPLAIIVFVVSTAIHPSREAPMPTFRTPLCVLENFLLQTHTIDNLPAKQGHRSHQILDFARIGE